MKNYILFIFLLFSFFASSQTAAQWDSIKAGVSPGIAPAFQNKYESAYRQPLSAYGWEDGIHISGDGLHLYALYYPGDLFGFTLFFLNNLNTLQGCDLLGNPEYIRPYAETFGMDITTNPFDCDTFINVDIIYASRASTDLPFTEWTLSGIAKPASLQGGPMPLFNKTNPALVDIFMFTGDGDIWIIRNTTANPSGIEQAIRLDPPINAVENEFNADNPHLERLNGDTLLLVYEKYTNPDFRDFMYAFSYDDGITWTSPLAMTTVSPALGKIEHPHLYQNPMGEWSFYFSIDCEIYRAKQEIPGNWDSWQDLELVITKGNSECVGEPSLTAKGDISFAVVYKNLVNNDSTDTYDIDPWFLPIKDTVNSVIERNPNFEVSIFPNPFTGSFQIQSNIEIEKVIVYNLFGQKVYESKLNDERTEILLKNISKGIYFIEIQTPLKLIRQKMLKN